MSAESFSENLELHPRVGKMGKFVLELLLSSGTAPFLLVISLPLFLLLFQFLVYGCLNMSFQGAVLLMVLHLMWLMCQEPPDWFIMLRIELNFLLKRPNMEAVAFTAPQIITVPCSKLKMSTDTSYTNSNRNIWMECKEATNVEHLKCYLMNIRLNGRLLPTDYLFEFGCLICCGFVCLFVWSFFLQLIPFSDGN